MVVSPLTCWSLVALGALGVLTPAWAQTGDSTEDLECHIPRRVANVRPDDDGPPTVVKLGLFVVDIVKIEAATESFTADFVLTLQWQDPRLAAANRGASLDDCIVALDDIWHPRVTIVNQRRIWPRGRDLVRVDDQGNVDYQQRYFGEMSSPFELQDFPFDRQRLSFLFASSYGPEELILEGDAALTGHAPRAAIAGWTLTHVEDAPHTEPVHAAGREFAITEFTMVVDRQAGYYIWKVFVPMTLIVGMASIVFWMDPANLGPQIGVSTASVFSLIAYLLSLNRFLPTIPYLTKADLFVLACVVLVFGALVISVTTSRLTQTDRRALALRIDKLGRWIFPLVFGVILVAIGLS